MNGIDIVGPAASLDVKQFEQVWFIPNDTLPPGTENDTAEVEVSAGTNSRTLKFAIQPCPLDHIDVTINPDTIVYEGQSAQITAIARDKEGNEAWMSDNAMIKLRAEPNNIGTFYPDSIVPYSSIKNGSVYYAADQIEPAGVQDVSISITGKGFAGAGKVVVESRPCLVMKVSGNEVKSGDSIQITMQQKDCFGNVVQYPQDQIFYIWMNTDESYGRFRDVNGNEGTYLEGSQPFEFISADSIKDSTKVEIEAWTYSGGGGVSSIRSGKSEGMTQGAINLKVSNLNPSQNLHRTKLFNKLKKRFALIKNGKVRAKLNEEIDKLEAQLKYGGMALPNIMASIKTSEAASEETTLEDAGESCQYPVAEVGIKKNSCKDAPQCNSGIIIPPTFEINVQTNPEEYSSDQYIDGCQKEGALGSFSPILDKANNTLVTDPYDVHVCFDQILNKWTFSIYSPIKIKILIYFCNSKISTARLVRSVSDVDDFDKCQKGLDDFNGHYNYPIKYSKYLIAPVVELHETIHKMEFEDRIAFRLYQDKDIFTSINYACEDFSNYTEAQKKIEDKIRNRVIMFLRRCANEYFANLDEQKTQSSLLIRLMVNDFIEKLGCE